MGSFVSRPPFCSSFVVICSSICYKFFSRWRRRGVDTNMLSAETLGFLCFVVPRSQSAVRFSLSNRDARWRKKSEQKRHMAIRKITHFEIQIRTEQTVYVPIIDELRQIYMIDWINECIRIFLSILFPRNTERNNFFLEKLAPEIYESFYSIL